MTNLAWLVIATFGALPFAFSELELSYHRRLLRIHVGVTTTGSTVITGLDTRRRAFCCGARLLQWLGGIGIIVMAVAILPILRSAACSCSASRPSRPTRSAPRGPDRRRHRHRLRR